jgi:hypothetical protein
MFQVYFGFKSFMNIFVIFLDFRNILVIFWVLRVFSSFIDFVVILKVWMHFGKWFTDFLGVNQFPDFYKGFSSQRKTFSV